MPNAQDIYGVVYKDSAPILLARVVGNDGANLQQADLSSAKYTVYELDDHDPDAATAVTGHTDVAVAVASLIFDTLQTDALWGSLDGAGYNLKWQIDVSANQAFAEAGKSYRIIFTLAPTTGQPILVRFQVRCI